MTTNTCYQTLSTNDKIIRIALRNILNGNLKKYRSESGQPAEIFEELGVRHGIARIDIAVINGVMDGYEIKSDRDTLERLPEQIDEFNTVFDKLTLVVGRHHLYDAIKMIPDWWGIMVAKIDTDNKVFFQTIREAEENKNQDRISIARLLWRQEALQILEERNSATGIRSKPRELVYERLAQTLSIETLKERVRRTLISREDWRCGLTLSLSGD